MILPMTHSLPTPPLTLHLSLNSKFPLKYRDTVSKPCTFLKFYLMSTCIQKIIDYTFMYFQICFIHCNKVCTFQNALPGMLFDTSPSIDKFTLFKIFPMRPYSNSSSNNSIQ